MNPAIVQVAFRFEMSIRCKHDDTLRTMCAGLRLLRTPLLVLTLLLHSELSEVLLQHTHTIVTSQILGKGKHHTAAFVAAASTRDRRFSAYLMSPSLLHTV